jgi:hypothetical protein
MSLMPSVPTSFFMGQQRKDGLRLKVRWRRGLAYADVCLPAAFEGYENVLHGALVFGILDTLIWYAVFMETGKSCMTRKTDMDYFKPVMCGVNYRAYGKLLRVEDRDVWTTAWIENREKERLAQVTALFREPKEIDYGRIAERLDFTGVSPEVKEVFLSAARRYDEAQAGNGR